MYLLVKVYTFEGDFKRVIKFLETNNKSNLNLGDSLQYICRRPRVRRELSYYLLHVLNIKASAIFKIESAAKSLPVYQLIT